MIKEKEVNELPVGWVDCNIEDISISLRRGPFGSVIKKSFFVKEGFKVYEQRNAIYKSDKIGNYYISENKFNELSDFEVKPLDFILSCSGTIGKLFQIPEKAQRGIINQALMRIRIDNGVMNYQFFSYLFDYAKFTDAILVESRGVAIKNIVGIKEFKNVEIKLPPLNEQNRIVEKLDELLSELEKGKEQLQYSLEQLKVYRQSILKHAFEGKLSEEWRKKQKKLKTPDELVAEVKDYRRQKYEKQSKEFEAGKTKVKPKQPKDIKIIAETLSNYSGWVLSKLGEVFETTSGGTPSRNNPRYYSGNIPWVKSGELKYNTILDTEEKISKEAIENSSAKLFPKGTLLVALYGATVGKLAFLGIEASTNQAVCGVFEETYYDHKFLYYYLMFMRPELLNQSTGGAQPNISQTILSNLPVPLCSKEEQIVVVEQIDKLFSLNDEMEKTIEENLMKSDALKQGLLQKAFEGKLVEQDLEDEPASVLLERIKKEREEYLKAEKEKQKIQKEPMKKKSTAIVFEFPLLDTIKEKFGKKSFTFDQLKSEVDINYDDLREELFSLLDNENQLIMEFDKKKESMNFKYVGK